MPPRRPNLDVAARARGAPLLASLLVVFVILAIAAVAVHLVRNWRTPFERACEAFELAAAGRHDEALEVYDRAIAEFARDERVNPGYMDGSNVTWLPGGGRARDWGYVRLGVALAWKSASLVEVGRPREALEASMGYGASDARVRCARVGVLAACGRHAEALDLADWCVEHYPRDAGAHVSRAFVLCDMGDPDAALESARAALELDPRDADARQLCDELAGGGGR